MFGFMEMTATRSVERALNERRRALKLLQKETKRHSGAKVFGLRNRPVVVKNSQNCLNDYHKD